MGFMENLRNKYELYKLEQRYTRREKRTTFYSGAQYVDGEYVYSPTSSTKSGSSFGSGSKRMSTIQVKEIFSSNGNNNTPLMHHHRGLVRAACTAQNAYDPALALVSALLPASDYAPRHCLRASPTLRPRTSGAQKRSFTARLPLSSSAQIAAKAEDGENTGEDQAQKEGLKKKGTFAGYEALMPSYVNTTRGNQHAQPNVGTARTDRAYIKGKRASGQHDGMRQNNSYNRQHRTEWKEQTLKETPTIVEDVITLGSAQLRAIGDNGIASDRKAHMRRIGEQANVLAQCRQTLSAEEIDGWREKMDYEGIAISPQSSPLDQHVPFPWTVATTRGAPLSGMEMLNREIELFMQYAQPTRAEITARETVRHQAATFTNTNVSSLLRAIFFGSERTGLFSATSDLDFRLQLINHPRGTTLPLDEYVFGQMHHLWERMQKDPNWILAVIRNAKYPIINAQHRETGIDIQIVSSPPTAAQNAATMYYLDKIPNLKQLYFVVKSMLSMRGLADAYNGGTGSYGLLHMLVASLTRRGADYTHAEPGIQLLQFLDFWCEHDYERNGVALAPPRPDAAPQSTLFRKHGALPLPRRAYIRVARERNDHVRAGQWAIGQARPFQPYLPCIQDPANPLNDLGRKMNAIKHIVATLEQVRTELRARMDAVDGGERLGDGDSLLETVVGRCHEVYLDRRRRVEEFGLRTMMDREARRKAGGLTHSEKVRERRQQQQQQQEEQKAQAVETAWAG